MARLQVLLMALFISAIALDQSFVNAKFSKSMYFTPGANSQSAILGNGDDLQLVLDNTAGKHNLLVTYNY
jgi:xyloglucan:xyloglucosyl transferase